VKKAKIDCMLDETVESLKIELSLDTSVKRYSKVGLAVLIVWSFLIDNAGYG